MEATKNHELTMTREFDVSCERVFNAWTDLELVRRWWGPNGVSNEVIAWDAKPGGKIELTMVAGPELGPMEGQRWPMNGEFKEVDFPSKLVFTSKAIIDGKEILENLTTVTFNETGGKTIMTVHVQVTRTVMPEAEGPLSGMEMGWNQQLDKLVDFMIEKAK